MREHGRKRRQAVEPGTVEDEVMIRAEMRIAEVSGGIGKSEQVIERPLLAVERDKGEVCAELHADLRLCNACIHVASEY